MELQLRFAPLKNDGLIEMVFEIINAGEATAYKFGIHISCDWRVAGFDGILDYGKPKFEAAEPIRRGRNAFVHPDFVQCHTLAQTIGVRNGTVWFFVFGLMRYEDERGNEFIEPFCRRFNHLQPEESAQCPASLRDKMVEELPKPENRPEMTVDVTNVILSEPPRIEIQFRNAGDSSAYKIEVDHWLCFRPIAESEQRLVTPPAPTEPPDTMPVIARDGVFSPGFALKGFPVAKWGDIKRGSSELFLLLRLRYADNIGTPYRFERCWRYNPTLNKLMVAHNRLWPVGFDPHS